MSGLTAETPIEIKAGALELAQALNDVLTVLKSPTEVYNKLLAEHKALQATKIEHQKILDENDKLLSEHKSSRVAFNEQQKKAKIAQDIKDKDYSDREQENLRQQTAINAQKVALDRKDKELKELAASLSSWEENNKKKEANISERETAFASIKQQVEADKNAIKDKQEKLRAVIG